MFEFIKKGIRRFWQLELYKASIFTNGLIYFAGRIPIIGRFVPTKMLYPEYGLKRVISYIKIALSFLFKLLLAFIPFILSFLWPILLSNMFNIEEATPFLIWIIFFVFIWSSFSMLFGMFDNKELQFIKNFHVSRTMFFKEQAVLSLFGRTLLIVLGLIMLLYLSHSSHLFLSLFFGLSLYILTNFLLLFLNVVLTVRSKKFIKKIMVSVLLSAIFLIIGLILVNYQQEIGAIRTILFSVGSIVNLAISAILMTHFIKSTKMMNFVNSQFQSSTQLFSDEDTVDKTKQKNFVEGQNLSKSMRIEDEDFSHLSGTDYINALFFSRLKRVLNRGVYIKVAIISAIGMGLTLFALFFPLPNGETSFETVLYNAIPFLFYILFFISVGRNVVQSMFVNCDVSVLSYPFYRQKQVIISSFFYRLKRIFIYNCAVNAILFFWIVVLSIVVVGTKAISFLWVILLIMLSLTLLFSFHELFIYYILQPFTTNFQVVNPVYKWVNGLFYIFAFINLQIDSAGMIYAVSLAGVSLLYVIIGSIVISRVAPKTFKLKN